MMSTHFMRRAGAAALLATLGAAAQAHTGHATQDLAAGLAHPFMGPDHLLAMLAVGLWSAAALPAGRRLLGPATFMVTLLIGALLGAAGFALPAAEAGIALNVLLLAGMLLWREHLPATAGLALVAASALLHGHAHGTEFMPGASFAAYAGGLLAATALLHAAGLFGGHRMAQASAWAWRGVAALMGSAGLVMLAARI
jgi:urease accessory protein